MQHFLKSNVLASSPIGRKALSKIRNLSNSEGLAGGKIEAISSDAITMESNFEKSACDVEVEHDEVAVLTEDIEVEVNVVFVPSGSVPESFLGIFVINDKSEVDDNDLRLDIVLSAQRRRRR